MEHCFSEWKTVTSGVRQVSMLAPVLFVIYISKLDDNAVDTASKFADNTKMGSIEDIEGCKRIQIICEGTARNGKWNLTLTNVSCCTLVCQTRAGFVQ